MKLNAQNAKTYISARTLTPISLVFGENITETRNYLQKLVFNALGENAQSEMRLEQLDPKALSQDQTLLHDAIRSSSFFPGAQGIVIYEATDKLADILYNAVENWQDGDAYIFVQAGNLKKTSKLRKILEPHARASVLAFYDDPITPNELNEKVKQANLLLDADGFKLLAEFCSTYDKTAIDPLIEKLSLYQNEGETLGVDDLEALLPGQYAGKTDMIINALFEGQFAKLVNELRRAPAQGISLRQLNMMAIYRANQLVKLISTGNPQQAIGQMRPPLFGERRQAIERNIRQWRADRIETALTELLDAEKEMRSGNSHIPETAYLERVFLRVARLSR